MPVWLLWIPYYGLYRLFVLESVLGVYSPLGQSSCGPQWWFFHSGGSVAFRRMNAKLIRFFCISVSLWCGHAGYMCWHSWLGHYIDLHVFFLATRLEPHFPLYSLINRNIHKQYVIRFWMQFVTCMFPKNTTGGIVVRWCSPEKANFQNFFILEKKTNGKSKTNQHNPKNTKTKNKKTQKKGNTQNK